MKIILGNSARPMAVPARLPTALAIAAYNTYCRIMEPVP